jgi:hypothetical protein
MARSKKPVVSNFDELAVFLAMNKIVWNRTRRSGDGGVGRQPKPKPPGFSPAVVDSPAIGRKRLRFLAEKVFQGYREAEMGETDNPERARIAIHRLLLRQ